MQPADPTPGNGYAFAGAVNMSRFGQWCRGRWGNLVLKMLDLVDLVGSGGKPDPIPDELDGTKGVEVPKAQPNGKVPQAPNNRPVTPEPRRRYYPGRGGGGWLPGPLLLVPNIHFLFPEPRIKEPEWA